MKKILSFLAGLLLTAAASATLLTGTIKDSQGRNVSGTLTLTPSVRGNVMAGACGGPYILSPVPPLNVAIVNGSPPSGSHVPGNDCIAPANSYYGARLVASNGIVLFSEFWRITGMSVNVGQILPVVSPTAPDTPVNGDVTGSLSQTVVSRLAGVPLTLTPPVTGQILKFDGTSWVAGSVSGTGTVTSVALSAPAQFSVLGSPITSGGTLALSWANQTANSVLAGPGSGSAAAPTFRLLVAGDIPAIPESGVTGLVGDLAARALAVTTVTATPPLTGSGSLGAPLTLGISVFGASGGGHSTGAVPDPGNILGTTRCLFEDATWKTCGGVGAVTSVGLAAPGIFSVTGSPVTSSGTLTLGLAPEAQAAAFMGPASGGAGTPIFRALVNTDIPNISEAQVTNLSADLAAKAPTSRSVATLAPMFGSGTLAADLTLGISNFTPSVAGAVPPSGGGTANFLRADATFQPVVTSVAIAVPPELTVSGSPVTGSGTITIGRLSQTANLIYAGPAVAPAAPPTFRAMAAADLPAIPESQVTNLVADLAGKVPNSTTVTTSAPLTGGGALAGSLTFGLSLNASGCLSAAGGLGIATGCITDSFLASSAGFLKRDGTTALTGPWNAGAQNVGVNVSPSYAWHVLGGSSRIQALATPAAPAVSPVGTSGSTTYTYQIVAHDRNGGVTLSSTTGTTTSGNATLSGSNYNHVSWAVVAGASSYDVLKNGTSSSLITSYAGTSYDDIGGATAAYTVPVRNTTADLTVDGNIAVGGLSFSSLSLAGSVTASNFISTVATGTAPIAVTSTTPVANLTLAADSQLPTISTSSKVSNSATTATSANTASTIVARDGFGNFSAGTITATLNGTATGITSNLAVSQGGTSATTAAGGFNNLNPMTTTGDMIYESGSSTAARLAGNSTAAKQFLSSTGTGSAATAPTWSAISGTDITSIAESQVVNLVTDLASKVPTTRQVIAGAGLAGGGALSSDATLSVPNSGIADSMIASAPSPANNPSSLVKRDAFGNFAAGTVTGSFSGNLTGSATSFSGPLTGDVTGTQSATVVGSVGGLTASSVATGATLANAATSANTASTVVKRDGSGGFSAGTVTAAQFSGPATALKSATTSVDVSASAAPASGSILQASGPSAAAWVATSGTGAPVGSGRQVLTSAPLTGGGSLSGDLTLGITPCGASGVSHSAGYVPDPGSSAGTAKFLREDCTWSAAGGGAVSSVGLSAPSIFSVTGTPVTSTGTLTFDFINVAANLVLAGPSSGGSAYPGFRALEASDVPNIAESQVTNLATDLGNKVPATRTVSTTAPVTGGGALSSNLTLAVSPCAAGGGHTSGIAPDPGTATGRFLRDDCTWAGAPGGGTVTSVDIAVPSEFTISGNPITGGGTMTIGTASQSANAFWAAPDGFSGAPGFRLMAPNDLPNGADPINWNNTSSTLGLGTQASNGEVLSVLGAVNAQAVGAPPAPSASVTGTSGNVNVGTHSYVEFFLVPGGRSFVSASSSVITVTSSAKQVSVSLALGPHSVVVARELYRTVAGDTGNYKFVATIMDNSTVTYIDDVADGSLGDDAPTDGFYPNTAAWVFGLNGAHWNGGILTGGYGGAAITAGPHAAGFILSGDANTFSPNMTGSFANAEPVITLVAGAGGRPGFEMGQTADSNNTTLGTITGVAGGNTASPPGNRSVASIEFQTEGTTAGQRGGRIRLLTKGDNGTNHDIFRLTSGGMVGLTNMGATLTPSSDTIAPTASIHHVAAGNISTIVVPDGILYSNENVMGAVLYLIPDGAFTLDTADNIAIASTATPGRLMTLVWDGTKWYPSY